MANELILTEQESGKKIKVHVNHVFNAGYAGSDQEKVQEHIDELKKLGVPTPETTPTLYPVAENLITTTDKIQVQHHETSGEIEYVLIWSNGELFVTVGCDHTDRKLETYSVPMSKQAYPNVLAKEVWRFEDVKEHWGQLEFTCWITDNGERKLYQKGKCADLMTPAEWKDNFKKLKVDEDGNFFFSATINTLTNSLTFAEEYEFQIEDPILNRKISHHYHVEVLSKAIE